MATPNTHHNRLLLDIIKTEGITGEPSIQYRTATDTANGYTANYSVIEIAGENKSLELFVKSAPKGSTERRPITRDVFVREIYFYETIQPQFKKFQLDRNVKQVFTGVPKCYACTYESLMMENLRIQGYVSYGKKGDMDDEHLLSILRQYARFHSISYAMKDQNRQLFNELSKNLGDLTGAYFRATKADVVFTQLAKRAKEMFNADAEFHISTKIQNIEEICGNIFEGIDEFMDDYSAITHGDCWFNNLMFKYKGSTLKDVKLLDWQMMRLNSPVLDLSHFFYSVANKEALANLEFYLQMYHGALSENIREMGSDPSKLYPYSAFEEHWRKYSRFGLVMAFGNVRFLYSEKEEVRRMLELANSGVPYLEAFTIDIKNQNLYVQRVRDIIRHFVCREFI